MIVFCIIILNQIEKTYKNDYGVTLHGSVLSKSEEYDVGQDDTAAL